MAHDLNQLIDKLSQNAPTRPPLRQHLLNGLALAAGTGLSLLMTIYGLGIRPDLLEALTTPVFLLKMALGLACLAYGVMLLRGSWRPQLHNVKFTAIWLMLLGLIALGAAGEILPAVDPEFLPGWACSLSLMGLSLPVILALVHWSHLAATTRPEALALAIGLTAYGPATLIFALHCPYSHASFVLFWYGLGLLATLLAARWLLPSRLRW